VNPLRLNPVEPGTLDRQPARDDAHATVPLVGHLLIVLAQPRFDLFTHMSLVYNNVAAMCPTGAELGQKLFDSQQLQSWSKQGRSASFVVNQLIKIAQELLQSTAKGY